MNTLTIFSKQLFRMFLLSGVAFTACKSRPDYTSSIRAAEVLLWDNPDSSMVILTRLENAELEIREKAEYLLARIFHADINSKVDAASEGIVLSLADYFNETCDKERQAVAAYLAGKAYQAAGKHQQAKNNFSDACKLAGEIKHEKLTGIIMLNIGLLNFQKGIYPEALTSMKESLLHIKDDGVHFAPALTGIGKTFLHMNMKDSAFFYFDKALAVSERSGNQSRFSAVLYNINTALAEAGEYDRAKSYHLQALHFMEEGYKAAACTNLAGIYYRARQTDSALYFAEKAYLMPGSFDMNHKCQLFGLLSRIEAEKGNHPKSQAYHEQMLDMANTMQAMISNVAIPEEYRMSRYGILLNKTTVKGTLAVIGFIAALAVIGITIVWAFTRHRKDKRIMEDAKHDVEKRDKTIEYHTWKEQDYWELLEDHCNMLKNISTFALKVDYSLKRDKRLMKLIVEIASKDEATQMEKLYVYHNILYHGYFEKIRQHFRKFPQLDEIDFYIWFLSYLKLSQAEMGSALGFATRTIQGRKTRMRSVFGLEKNADILSFVINEVGKESMSAEPPPAPHSSPLSVVPTLF